ncbi:MAG: hypothetical protein QM714_14195 [Nocardioides sp.]|uniref:hypothetical protein n=1 Tax=Nocardioides sp. TaxID=35761 RepID=UPI0039E248FF
MTDQQQAPDPGSPEPTDSTGTDRRGESATATADARPGSRLSGLRGVRLGLVAATAGLLMGGVGGFAVGQVTAGEARDEMSPSHSFPGSGANDGSELPGAPAGQQDGASDGAAPGQGQPPTGGQGEQGDGDQDGGGGSSDSSTSAT